jgi:hypothetical protein
MLYPSLMPVLALAHLQMSDGTAPVLSGILPSSKLLDGMQ